MSSLLDSLNSLKDKINAMEKDISKDNKEVEIITIDNKEILKNNMTLFKKMQSQKVSIDVGGSLYAFSKDCLSIPFLKNIFNINESSVFYDGSPILFRHIANIFRHFNNPSNLNTPYQITLKQSEDEIILKAMINDVFTDVESVMTKVKIEREVKKERVINNQQVPNVANVEPNYNDNRGAAYNYNY